MLIIKQEDFSPEFPLEGIISFSTKKDILSCCTMAGFRMPASYKKEEAAAVFSATMLSNMEYILRRLPFYELDILKRLVLSHTIFIDYPLPLDSYLFIEESGLVVIDDSLEYSCIRRYMTVDAVKQAILPVLDKVIKERESLCVDTVERLTIGVLNIYGKLSTENLVEILEEISGYSKEKICSVLQSSILIDILRRSYEPKKKDSYILYPLSWRKTEDIDHIVSKTPGIYMQYPKGVYEAFGSFPYVEPLWKESSILYNYIYEEFPRSSVPANVLFHIAWQSLQTSDDPDNALFNMGPGIRINTAFNSKFKSFSTHFPLWRLAGGTIEPISELSQQ